MQILNYDMSPRQVKYLDEKTGQKGSFIFQPSGFVAQLGGGFRQENLRHMKPMVERKVVDTLSVAQAKVKLNKYL